MLAHLEDRKCYLMPWQLHALARAKDPRHAFTTAAITEPFFPDDPASPLWECIFSPWKWPLYYNCDEKKGAPWRFVCPRPWCGGPFRPAQGPSRAPGG